MFINIDLQDDYFKAVKAVNAVDLPLTHIVPSTHPVAK